MAQHSKLTHGHPTVEQLAVAEGVYPLDAYQFVQEGLHYTVDSLQAQAQAKKPRRHVSGQELALGLREYAHIQWGGMARAVLGKWNVTCTFDFGRIVFAMVEAGLLQRTEEDSIEDFRGVYDFASLDAGYRIESKL